MARWTPNFHWITDDLAVGGAFPRGVEPLLAERHRIGAVVDLREEACDDQAALARAGIDFLHLPTVDLHPSALPMLDEGVDWVRSAVAAGRRTLIHCQHGIGRSAILALCVMVAEGWDPMDALNRAKDQRALVSPSEAQYEGWLRWLKRWNARTGAKATLPGWEAYCAVAYRHLAQTA